MLIYKKFKKHDRIFLTKEIESVFKKGISINIGPLNTVFLEKNTNFKASVSILISVPKKYYKQAVKRNKIKRWIREAYRLNKNILYDFFIKRNATLYIAFVFLYSNKFCYNDIEKWIIKSLNLIIRKYYVTNKKTS